MKKIFLFLCLLSFMSCVDSYTAYKVKINKAIIVARDTEGIQRYKIGDSVCVVSRHGTWYFSNSDIWENKSDTFYYKEMGISNPIDTIITKYRLGVIY